MAEVRVAEERVTFVGSVDASADVASAGEIAAGCPGYSPDDDDECYVDSELPNCFNCRARRWAAGGFTCMKGLLHG